MKQKLWTHQKQIIRAITAGSKSCKKLLVESPTGSGKRVIFCEMARRWSEEKKRVIIIVHTRELRNQVADNLRLLGVTHGFIQHDRKETNDLVQIAMVRSLENRIKKGKHYKADYLVVDEAHHSVAGGWLSVIKYFKKSRVIGFTATPFRVDGVGLGICFDKIISKTDVTSLIKQKKLSPFSIFAPEGSDIDLSKIKVIGGEYSQKELLKKINKPKITGSAIEHYKKYLDGKTALVFCISIEHAIEVAKEFRRKGVRAEAIYGRLPMDERTEIIQKYAAKEIKVLTSIDVLCEGFDVRHTEGIIGLRPTLSLTRYIQMIGRGLRFLKSKKEAVIIEAVGNVFRFGFPDEKRKHGLKGLEQHTSWVHTCPKCRHVFRFALRACPKCGYRLDLNRKLRGLQSKRIIQIPGYLKKLERKELIEKNRERRSILAKCKSFKDYLSFAAAYNFSKPRGWARHMISKKKNLKIVQNGKRYCGHCKKTLDISNFNEHSRRCYACQKKYRKEYYIKNAVREKEKTRQWQMRNPEKVKEFKRRNKVKNHEAA